METQTVWERRIEEFLRTPAARDLSTADRGDLENLHRELQRISTSAYNAAVSNPESQWNLRWLPWLRGLLGLGGGGLGIPWWGYALAGGGLWWLLKGR